MRPRTTPLAAYDEIRSVARLRLRIPTDKDLAERWHMSLGYVRQLMHRERKQLTKELDVSCESPQCDDVNLTIPTSGDQA